MLSCIAIDDEQPALDIISHLVSECSGVALKAVFKNPEAAETYLKNNEIDLMFLDIEMPDISGIDFLRKLQNPPMVILTTAYEKYAVKSYELEVVDYLVKPIPLQRFQEAIAKTQKLHSLHQQQQIQQQNDQKHLYVKADYQLYKIDLDDILYIEGLKDYVKIYTTNGRILSRMNVKQIGLKLPSTNFIRVHRSYIVPFDKIDSFQKSQLFIKGQSIPIGEQYRDALFDKINPYL